MLRWSTSLDPAYVSGVVRRGGGWFVPLDLAGAADASGLHTALATALDFPDYYGRNLDALNDCLGDLADRGRGVPVLFWQDWVDLEAADPRLFATVAGLLGEWVLLVLPSDPPGVTPRAG